MLSERSARFADDGLNISGLNISIVNVRMGTYEFERNARPSA
jgi:hypothetical protein